MSRYNLLYILKKTSQTIASLEKTIQQNKVTSLDPSE